MNLNSIQFMNLSRFERMGLIQFSYAKTWSPGRYGSAWPQSGSYCSDAINHSSFLHFQRLNWYQLVPSGNLT